LVHLTGRSREPVHTFSCGMKKRWMIACALIHNPPVLFLDEPTRGLDPIAAHEIRSAIEQRSQNGKTILLTTHLLEEADQLCRHVAFIVNGHIVANDTPQNLKLSHGKRSLELTIPDPNKDDHHSQLGLSMDEPKDRQYLADLKSQGKVLAIHSQEATLEDVFIEIAGIRPA